MPNNDTTPDHLPTASQKLTGDPAALGLKRFTVFAPVHPVAAIPRPNFWKRFLRVLWFKGNPPASRAVPVAVVHPQAFCVWARSPRAALLKAAASKSRKVRHCGPSYPGVVDWPEQTGTSVVVCPDRTRLTFAELPPVPDPEYIVDDILRTEQPGYAEAGDDGLEPWEREQTRLHESRRVRARERAEAEARSKAFRAECLLRSAEDLAWCSANARRFGGARACGARRIQELATAGLTRVEHDIRRDALRVWVNQQVEIARKIATKPSNVESSPSMPDSGGGWEATEARRQQDENDRQAARQRDSEASDRLQRDRDEAARQRQAEMDRVDSHRSSFGNW